MLLEALSAVLLASAAQAEAPPPSLARHPGEDLLIAIRGRCPPVEPRVRSAKPDELLRLETGFRDQLSAPDRSRLDQARRGGARCTAKSGASCQADAALSAVVDSDLLGAFAEYVCARETAAAAPR
jgi:hypothetical protein